MGRSSFREKLIGASVHTLRERGFATIGVREITAAAGVAQGSFTNHFASKEAFGVAVLNRYSEENRVLIASTVGDKGRRPLERINAYFDAAIEYFAGVGWRYGCLAGNLALEASEHSEPLRNRLAELFVEWSKPFVEAIRDAQIAQEIPAYINPEETAAALLEAWQGAMLRMKVDRTPAALQRFQRVAMPAILAIPTPQPSTTH